MTEYRLPYDARPENRVSRRYLDTHPFISRRGQGLSGSMGAIPCYYKAPGGGAPLPRRQPQISQGVSLQNSPNLAHHSTHFSITITKFDPYIISCPGQHCGLKILKTWPKHWTHLSTFTYATQGANETGGITRSCALLESTHKKTGTKNIAPYSALNPPSTFPYLAHPLWNHGKKLPGSEPPFKRSAEEIFWGQNWPSPGFGSKGGVAPPPSSFWGGMVGVPPPPLLLKLLLVPIKPWVRDMPFLFVNPEQKKPYEILKNTDNAMKIESDRMGNELHRKGKR